MGGGGTTPIGMGGTTGWNEPIVSLKEPVGEARAVVEGVGKLGEALADEEALRVGCGGGGTRLVGVLLAYESTAPYMV